MPTSPYRGPIGGCVRSIVINSGLGRSEQIRGKARQGKGKGRAGEEGNGVRRVVVTSPEAAGATVDLQAAVGACGGRE